MFKILGSLLIFVGSLYWGITTANKFKYRRDELLELERCINELKNEITYTYTSIPDILMNISLKSKKPISTLFKKISNMLYDNKVNSIYEAFSKGFSEEKDNMALKEEDIDIILDLSKNLGQWDPKGHENIIELALYNLKKQSNRAEESMIKNMKMYKYLGFSIGAVLVIIFI
ncbi:stage III sporulation protein SpoAB [Clostridium botulinum]|uniref:Stage III sporulation protein SpoAB n=1 Tax=Clostridium botulinum TaxID=1491 RepID=A0AA44BS13_CLOBO|nr:stage III sporulation protein SpoAB [Clostridium botulinum]NFI22116.1 stage III sporulation protein SpoAB [Clostridium botulinum]NFQ77985.1 stage III sporulation protein SpoAB [Clostridium botulinum]